MKRQVFFVQAHLRMLIVKLSKNIFCIMLMVSEILLVCYLIHSSNLAICLILYSHIQTTIGSNM